MPMRRPPAHLAASAGRTSAPRRALAAAFLLLLAVGPHAAAQLRPTRKADSAQHTAAAEQVSPASPRASLEHYFELARAGRYAEAARYLDVPDSLTGEEARLARELKAVLDRHAWIDVDDLSPLAAGDTTDGLPAGVDQVATIVAGGGVPQPVRLARAEGGQKAYWRFSRGTVGRIPAWYDALGDRWLIEHLPAPLLRTGPFEILYWQWLVLPLLVALAAGLGALASRLARAAGARAVSRTATQWDDAVLDRVAGPLTVGFALLVTAALLPLLGLYAPAAEGMTKVVRAGVLLVLFWAVWRLVDVGRAVVGHSRWALHSPSSRTLVPLGARVTKIVVLAIAAIATLSLFGYPVASLLAGLGLGGLALALAAQKTVENLFGAFSIGIDQPFREGDFVKVQDFVGTVEDIGLRSTRFRTLDRTLVTLPNGALADMKLESFAARDRLRLATTLGLVYETTAAQMRAVLAGLEGVLRGHPKIWPDVVVVRFGELAAASLNIDVMAWFQTSDWGEFQLIRQEVLLQFMDVVERAGTSFAFPTQTLHVASVPTPFGGAPRPGLPAGTDTLRADAVPHRADGGAA